MKRGNSYYVNVKAAYKDYTPLEFLLLVNYLPNLDGKLKIVDLGPHVFSKGGDDNRPEGPFTFKAENVMDDGLDDDYEDYKLSLRDSQSVYFELSDQSNPMEINDTKAGWIPKTGENTVTVSKADNIFLKSSRKFFTFSSTNNFIEMPLVAPPKVGELVAVLTWNKGVKIDDSRIIMENLDLHVEF